jgi:hypothetical protein
MVLAADLSKHASNVSWGEGLKLMTHVLAGCLPAVLDCIFGGPIGLLITRRALQRPQQGRPHQPGCVCQASPGGPWTAHNSGRAEGRGPDDCAGEQGGLYVKQRHLVCLMVLWLQGYPCRSATPAICHHAA